MLTLALLLQAAAPTCPATPPALPPSLAGWRATGGDLASMKATSLPTMDPATVRLADVPLPTRAGRMALATLPVRTAGTYGIALGTKGWIDIYRTGSRTPLVSTAHGHGPDCSGIRKIVRFTLTPGTYRVVLSGIDAASVKAMLLRE